MFLTCNHIHRYTHAHEKALPCRKHADLTMTCGYRGHASGRTVYMEETYDDAPTRYEINRLVRNILIRHRADMEVISISCTTRVVYLYGTLTKTTKPDYKPADVDILFREIEQIPMVRGIDADLENWSVSAVRSTGTWLVAPKRRILRPAAAAAGQEDYRIEKDEEITDVLDDIQKRKAEKPGT